MAKGIYRQAVSYFSAGILTASTVLTPFMGHALPQDGVVSSGSADISVSGTKLDIHQHSAKAVIDWRSFNIGVNEHTQFHQPSSGAIALNRVNDMNPSHIAGQLSANGNIILINPNGVFFEGTAQVDVNGLLATTANISNDDFMAHDRLVFDQAGNPNATITNAGRITAGEAGLVGLVAPNVLNSGVITARLGKVQLASADRFALDMYGDGLYELAISDEVASQLVANTGTLQADGGVVAMTAAAGSNIVNSLITVQGELKAPTIEQRGGKIIIGAPTDKAATPSTVRVGATLDVAGKSTGEAAGSVHITADQIALEGSSNIIATGDAGGGTVRIGGAYQGKGDTPTAEHVFMGADARIDASATHNGDGGEVILWADNHTQFHGEITSSGGTNGGAGGFVETSGKQVLSATGYVDVSAQAGQAGTWLLDPNNITIQDAGPDANVTEAPAGTWTTNANSGIVTTGSIETALLTGNVIVQTGTAGLDNEDGDITVANQIDWATNHNLTLDAHDDIFINANITGSGAGDATFRSNGIAINANISGNGTLTIEEKTDGTSIGLGTGAGTLSIDNAELGRLSGWSDYIFGGSNGTDGTSGELQINTTHDFADANLTFRSGVDIRLTGNLVKASGAGTVNYTFEADGDIFNSGTGNITITDNGAAGLADDGTINVIFNSDKDNSGAGRFSVQNLQVNTNGGDFIVGGGADPTLGYARGADQQSLAITGNSSIVTGSGDIVLRGFSSGTATQKHAVLIGTNGGADALSTTSGNITIIGQSDVTAADSYGVFIDGILATTNIRTGSGNITINGIGSPNATSSGHGLRLKDGTHLLSTSGNIHITAAAAGPSGGEIDVTGVNNIGGGTSGNITFVMDSYTNSNSVVNTTGTLTIEERTDGTTIGIGSGAGGLSINDTALANMTAGAYVFGGSNGTDGTSGKMTIATTKNFGDANVTFRSGADIELSGTLTKTTGNAATYSFQADEDIFNTNNAGIISASNALDVILWSDKDNAQNGAIDFGSTSSIITLGGDFVAGGALDDGADVVDADGNTINDGTAADGRPDGYAHGNASHVDGVWISGITLNTGAGNILMLGHGGAQANQTGIDIATATDIDTTAGHVTLIGRSNTVGDSGAAGVRIANAAINTQSGHITAYGYEQGPGDGGANDFARALNLSSATLETSSAIDGQGNITLIGDASDSTGNQRGVEFANATARTNAGDIRVDGEGTAAGFVTWQNFTLDSTGGGDITIDTASSTTNSVVGFSSPGGFNAQVGSAGTGDITVIANSFGWDSDFASSSMQGRSITIMPDEDAGMTVGLGTGAGSLSLDNTELSYMSADKYTFGRDTSGYFNIATTKDFGDADVDFISGNGLTIASDLIRTTNGNDAINGDAQANYRFLVDGNIINSTNADIRSTGGGALNLTFNADRDQATNVGGTVTLINATVTTAGGNVIIGGGLDPTTQYAMGSAASTQFGIRLQGSTINAGGGDVHMLGRGSLHAACHNNCWGISVTNSSVTTTGAGTLYMDGQSGGTTATNFVSGLQIYDGSTISTASGALTLIGQRLNTNAAAGGVTLGNGASVTTTGGKVTLNAGGNFSWYTGGGGLPTVNSGGALIIIADRWDSDYANINLTAATTLRAEEFTDGRAIGIGQDTGGLFLHNDHLGQMSATNYIFGGTDADGGTSGDMTIATNSTFGGFNATFNSGANISIAGNLTRTVGGGTAHYRFLADESIYNSAGADITTSAGALNLTFNADRDQAINPGGFIDFHGATIDSGGGDIVMGGGANPATGYALGILGGGNIDNGISLRGNTGIDSGGGNITMRGQGHNNGTANIGIFFGEGTATVDAGAAGNITLVGIGGAGTNNNHGIQLSNYTLTTQSGTISLTGTGNGTGTANRGVYLLSGADINTNSGNITINGTGANGTTQNQGVYLHNSDISTSAGAVHITGIGGAGSGSNNHGIFQFQSGNITTDSGNITLHGTGTGVTSRNSGVVISVARTRTQTGAIDIDALGSGAGNDNEAFGLDFGGRVESLAAGGGNIDITASYSNAPGSTSAALRLKDNSQITAVDAHINIHATAGGVAADNHAVFVFDSSDIMTTSAGNISITAIGNGVADAINFDSPATNNITSAGNLTLITDSINIADSLVQAQGTLTIEEYTDGTAIDIGTDYGATLSIDTAELAQMSAAHFIFGGTSAGNGTSGDITLNTPHDFADANLTLRSGNDIIMRGGRALTKQSGVNPVNYIFQANNTIRNFGGNQGGIDTTSGAINVTLNADRDANGTGGIHFDSAFNSANGRGIYTGGGDILIGGGADPTTGYIGYNGNSGRSIYLFDTALNAAGGDITIRAATRDNQDNQTAIRLANAGVSLTTNGTGSVTIDAQGGNNSNNVTVLQMGTGSTIVAGSGGATITANGPAVGTNNTEISAGFASITANGGNITVNGDVTMTGDVNFSATGGTAQLNGTLNGAHDSTIGGDTVVLGSAVGGNTALGTLTLTANSSIALPSINATTILVQANGGGDVTLNGTLNATGAGNALTLSATGDFHNNAGANALDAANGRWLVYSSDPANNTRGGLLPDASEFGKSYAANAPATIAAGNRLIYTTNTQQTLHLQTDNIAIDFNAAFAGSSLSYISGLLAGDVLAHIGQTGNALFSSPYTQGGAVGDYIINAATGTLSNALGYKYQFANGVLTVRKPLLPQTGLAAFGLAGAGADGNSLPPTVEITTQDPRRNIAANQQLQPRRSALPDGASDATATLNIQVDERSLNERKFFDGLIAIHPDLVEQFQLEQQTL